MEESFTVTIKIDDLLYSVKAGDLLYSVGPGTESPTGPTDLRVYSCAIRNVRLEGSYSASATPADFASATYAIELPCNRPFRGFPQGIYQDYEIGVKVHLSPGAALHAFIKGAVNQRDTAEREYTTANAKIQWATDQALAMAVPPTEDTP